MSKDHVGGAYSAPQDSLSGFKGAYFYGDGGKGAVTPL